mmetsp:Transcript_116469/g.340744  ORF Transcript_116469/g.340744 Transcript_116469/m.340744 type:complete len:321 (-) Transcript_116469:75-1037(-)
MDNHPAKIAKYLLKGWCLLNDYCPNGQNIPLVRSREGALVCAGCNPSCQYFATHGDQTQQSGAPGQPQTETTVGAAMAQPAPKKPTADMPPPAPTSAVNKPRVEFEAQQLQTPAQQVAPNLSGGAGPASDAPTAPVQGVVAVADGGSACEVAIQGQGLGFGCVRLSLSPGLRPRLLGDYFTVKARLALPGHGQVVDTDELRQALQAQCRRLAERTLLPQVQVERGANVVTISCEDGTLLSLPEHDCLLVQVPRVTPDVVAALLWDRLVAAPVMEQLCSSGAHWLEVSVTSGSGAEAAFRKPLGSNRRSSAVRACALANDW